LRLNSRHSTLKFSCQIFTKKVSDFNSISDSKFARVRMLRLCGSVRTKGYHAKNSVQDRECETNTRTRCELRCESSRRPVQTSPRAFLSLSLSLSVIIHSFTSHARLLFEYECAVRGVITALDHSPDAAATHFSSSVQCANIPWHPDILMLKAPSTPDTVSRVGFVLSLRSSDRPIAFYFHSHHRYTCLARDPARV
jgi:hypothetical protein